MNINWIKESKMIKPGLEEGSLEINWRPGSTTKSFFGDVKPQNDLDLEEREWLIKESDIVIKEIDKDVLTRKALFYNLHPADLRVNCINIFHFMIRNKEEAELNLFVYARSINIKNFSYDVLTINEVYMNVFKKLIKKNVPNNLKVGEITFRIASLHEYK